MILIGKLIGKRRVGIGKKIPYYVGVQQVIVLVEPLDLEKSVPAVKTPTIA
jgi:hypothetical protein